MTDVLVIHPYRITRHKMYREHFFMPERPVQLASTVAESGYDVDFIDFSQTDLEENVHSEPTPRELKGTGWNFKRYGWTDEEVDKWLNNNAENYDMFLVDTLTPYFKDGVKHIVDYLDSEIGKDNVALFGEWVQLQPEDFQNHVALSRNWELGAIEWLEGNVEDVGVSTFEFSNYPLDDVPSPKWNEFVDMGKYPEEHCADYRAGRGCPETCGFCHVAGMYDGEISGRSADTIIEHLKFYIEEEGFTKIKLRDDNFCVRANVAYEVFEWLANNHPDVEILQPEGMEMKTAANVPDVIEQMGRCNYHSVRVGFETISEGNFQKNSLEWWEQAHENFKNAGFGPGEIVTFVMRGHPKLTRKDEIDTAIYLSDYDVTLLSGGYRLVPGTTLWDEKEEVLGLEGEIPYNYGHGLPQKDRQDEIQKLGQLYRVVSAWNEWGISLFHDENPVEELGDLSWVDSVNDNGDTIRVSGTVSGWTRTDGIEDGLAILLAARGYHNHTMEKNTKRVMEVKGIRGHDKWMKKVLDRAEKQGMDVESPTGLI